MDETHNTVDGGPVEMEPSAQQPGKELADIQETPSRLMYHLTEDALQELLAAMVRDALSRVRTTGDTARPVQPRRLFEELNAERKGPFASALARNPPRNMEELSEIVEQYIRDEEVLAMKEDWTGLYKLHRERGRPRYQETAMPGEHTTVEEVTSRGSTICIHPSTHRGAEY
ncbi:hypothetical protein Salat_2149800 [Sesamum alatum]|uniref:Uncharacterized protein n=1 Tax=Sesamum alatum TaxID=300844 RepID=A0AAE1Y1C9_9LAMI|nr:hypothetical protein Salat_2149800 [Sesamum alatum]